MNREISISAGDIIVKNDGNRYRILQIKEDKCITIQMDINRYVFDHLTRQTLIDNIINNTWILVKDNSDVVVDMDNLPEEAVKKYENDKNICMNIKTEAEIYGYDILFHSRNNIVHKWSVAYNVSEKKLKKMMRVFLQSGFNYISLIDKRYVPSLSEFFSNSTQNKRGKPGLGETDKNNMAKILNHYKKQKYMKLIDAYHKLLNDYYRETKTEGNNTIVSVISDNAPTYNQFYYYVRTHMTDYHRDLKKMKSHELRNNKRILTGSSSTGVRYPGEVVEIDECDFPVSLVSQTDHTQTIGRPNVYIMIDVLTHVVCAVGISFDQNSYVGLTNMFINLADDKVEYCKRYGIEIKPEEWYSNFIPARIRCDQGADFKSEAIMNVCKSLNIERNLEPIATGSMKGEIENLFHLLQDRIRPYFEGKGLITKDYGSKHHTEACITLHTFTKVLLLVVIEHNKKSMESFPMTDEMIAEGIKPRPYLLWDYYCQTQQQPMPIRNKNEYLLALMKNDKASVDRKGIHYLGRTYFCKKEDCPQLWDTMYANQNRKTYINIHFDPRNMNVIYYKSNNTLVKLEMSHEKKENIGFFNKSEQEIRMIIDAENRIKKEEEKYNLELQADTSLKITEVLKNESTVYRPVSKDMRESRHVEKHEVDKELYDIRSRFEGDKTVSDTAENNLVLPNVIEDDATQAGIYSPSDQSAVITDHSEMGIFDQSIQPSENIQDYDSKMTDEEIVQMLINGQKGVNSI